MVKLLATTIQRNVVHIGRGINSQTYHMNDHFLENVTEEKDLGVIVDDKLKFQTHTSAAIKKANSILGLLKRYFTVKDKITLPSLYTETQGATRQGG